MLGLPATRPAPLDHFLLESLAQKLSIPCNPQSIPVMAAPDADSTDCFGNVQAAMEESAGSIIYGWSIWLFPTVLLEAEFHAIWKDEKGALTDLTPRGFETTTFLPDPSSEYQGHQIDNVRIPLTQFPPILDFIQNAESHYELMNRGERKHQHGEIRLSQGESDEIAIIQENQIKALQAIARRNSQIGPNSPCICGSEKKFKKCCGR